MKRFNGIAACIRTLEQEGWFAHPVERRNKFGTLDWDGWADVVAWRRHPVTSEIKLLGVQVAVENTAQDHMEKLVKNSKLKPRWLDVGAQAQLWIYPRREDREEGNVTPRRVPLGG